MIVYLVIKVVTFCFRGDLDRDLDLDLDRDLEVRLTFFGETDRDLERPRLEIGF